MTKCLRVLTAFFALLSLLASVTAFAQNSDLQQKLAAVKQNVAENGGVVNLIFKDYALPGDQMTLTFDTNARKISSLNIDTYIEEPKDAVTLQVQMASLPDGTNYTQQTVLNATAKQLVVTTTNSKYQKLGG